MTTPPEPSQHLARAHVLLDDLDDQARHGGKFGFVNVRIEYRAGIATKVRCTTEGVETEKEICHPG